MAKRQIKGAGVALVTPMDENLALDYSILTDVINRQIDANIDFLVVMGTTGESTSLTDDEKKKVLQHTKTISAGRIPLVAGLFGGMSTQGVIDRIIKTDLSGYHAIMCSSPAYVKPSQEGIFRHYLEIAKISPLPIVIYNVPSRTGKSISPQTLLKITKHTDKIIAIKDATGDLHYGSQLLRLFDKTKVSILSGDDPTAIPYMSIGAHGCISVISNALPNNFTMMIHQALSGNFKSAAEIHLSMYPIHKWLYIESNPSGIKKTMELLGVGSPYVRLPLLPLSSNHSLKLKQDLEISLAKLENFPSIELQSL